MTSFRNYVVYHLVGDTACILRFLMECLPNVQIREYHRKHPAARVVDANEEEEALLKEEPQIEFSGEVSLSLSVFVSMLV